MDPTRDANEYPFSYEDDDDDDDDDPAAPPPDIHSKLRALPTHRSNKTKVRGLERMINAGDVLHRVVGERSAEPFPAPPAMPVGLETELLEGLQEYGLNAERMKREEEEKEKEAASRVPCEEEEEEEEEEEAAGAALQEESSSSVEWDAGIEEEEIVGSSSSPSLPSLPPTGGDKGKGKCPVGAEDDPGDPMEGVESTGHLHGTTATPEQLFMGPIEDIGGGMHVDEEVGSVRMCGEASGSAATHTPAENAASRDKGKGRALEFPSGPAPGPTPLAFPSFGSFDYVRSSPPGGSSAFAGYGLASGLFDVFARFRVPPSKSSSSDHAEQSIGYDALFGPSLHAAASSSGSSSSSSSPAPLFPSPRFGREAWDDDNANAGQSSSSRVTVNPSSLSPAFSNQNFFQGTLQPRRPVNRPKIVITPATPTGSPPKRKRELPPDDDDGEPPRPPRKDTFNYNTSGLPVLPASSKALWTTSFTGHTPGLLNTLLTWTHAMRSLSHRLRNYRAFAAHPAFPLLIMPPIYERLVSVGFYSNSSNNTAAHEEVRFLGPDDAAEMVYAEVDVFRTNADVSALHEKERCNSAYANMMKRFGLSEEMGSGDEEPSRRMDQTHLVMTGEGRWAYIFIRGHTMGKGKEPQQQQQQEGENKQGDEHKQEEEVAPHVVLAWHCSARTQGYTGLHTVLPDPDLPVQLPNPLPPSTQSLRRFVSLQNMRNQVDRVNRLHRELRSASSSEPPKPNALDVAQDVVGAKMFQRTVVKFEKSGSVPLIDGYRVDVRRFRAWMDAVGRGEGKIVFWREFSRT
ncbi:hypothetical protein ACJBU6_02595 [Exserohilum turcicum]